MHGIHWQSGGIKSTDRTITVKTNQAYPEYGSQLSDALHVHCWQVGRQHCEELSPPSKVTHFWALFKFTMQNLSTVHDSSSWSQCTAPYCPYLYPAAYVILNRGPRCPTIFQWAVELLASRKAAVLRQRLILMFCICKHVWHRVNNVVNRCEHAILPCKIPWQTHAPTQTSSVSPNVSSCEKCQRQEKVGVVTKRVVVSCH